MYQNEVAEKIRAASQYENTIGATQVNQAIGYGVDECAKQERALNSLHRRRLNAERENRNLDRVIDILTRHPEFEEFLEVLRSGLI